MAKITATSGGGLASVGATWVGGVAPVNGDTILINAGTTITWDIAARTLGSKVAGVGTAVEVRGAAGNPGKIIGKAGCVLTVRGFDRNGAGIGFGNTLVNVEQYGIFECEPGFTLLGDVATEGQASMVIHGILSAIGNAASRVIFDIPAANKAWGTVYSATTGLADYEYYDRDKKTGSFPLFAEGISNAAGTGPGSFGDSSLSFTSVAPASMCTTPVATLALVTGPGKYWVDHDGGTVFFYLDKAVSTTFQVDFTLKHVVNLGWGIRCEDDVDGNQLIARYCDFVGMGDAAFGDFAINIGSKYTAFGTNRNAESTHCRYRYGRGIGIVGPLVGTAASPIRLEDNEFQAVQGTGIGYALGLNVPFGAITNYVSFARNKKRDTDLTFLITNYGDSVHQNWSIQDNPVRSGQVIKGGTQGNGNWPGLDMSGNAMFGNGGGGDSRQIGNLGGTQALPARFHDNLSWRAMRAINFLPYLEIDDNIIGHAYHHTINPTYITADAVIAGLKIRRTLQLHGNDALSDLGYNTRAWLEQPEVTHNTSYDITLAALALCFPGTPTVSAQTGLLMSSNLVVAAAWAIRRNADIAGRMTRTHLRGMDYNNVFGLTVAFADGVVPRFCTVDGVANVAGVSLFAPSFAGPVSGKTLAYVYTSATNRTLAFDGGAPVQLVLENGTCTSAANPDALHGTFTVAGRAWSEADFTNAACPVGCWLVTLTGTGAGQKKRIIGVETTTRIKLAEPWTTIPDGTTTFAIIKAEVSVTGAAGTMIAGIDARDLPASSQTDSAVAISFHTLTVDPQFVDASRSVESWDASLGGPGTEDAAFERLYADPTLTRTSLLPYLRDGFRPQNALLFTAGHDGGIIGALAPAVGGGGTPGAAADFSTEPAGYVSNQLPGIVPVVRLLKPDGTVETSYNGPVTLSIATGAAAMAGIATVNAAAGVASFPQAKAVGAGPVSFRAVAPGFTDAVSEVFMLVASLSGVSGGFVAFPAVGLNFLMGPSTDPASDTDSSSTARLSQNTLVDSLARAPLTLAASVKRRNWAVGPKLSGTISYSGGATIIGSGTKFLTEMPTGGYMVIDVPASKDPLGEGFQYLQLTGGPPTSDTSMPANVVYGAYFGAVIGNVTGATYTTEDLSILGGGFNDVSGVMMYYDYGYALYQAAYKHAATTNGVILADYADRVARLWWDNPLNATPRRVGTVAESGINWVGSRYAALGTLLIWALRGCPGARQPNTVASVFAFCKNSALSSWNQWLAGKELATHIAYDVRDGGYALHWLTMLSVVHPDPAVRADAQAKAITAAVDYFKRLQYPDGSWRAENAWANYVTDTLDYPAAQPFLTGLLLNALVDLHRSIRTDPTKATSTAAVLAALKLGVQGVMRAYDGLPDHPGASAVTSQGTAPVRAFTYAYAGPNFGLDIVTPAQLIPGGSGNRWWDPAESIVFNTPSFGLAGAVAAQRFLNSTNVHAPFYAAIYETDPVVRASLIAFGDELLKSQWEWTDGDGYRSQWYTPFPKNKDWDEHMRAQMRALAWRRLAIAGAITDDPGGIIVGPPVTGQVVALRWNPVPSGAVQGQQLTQQPHIEAIDALGAVVTTFQGSVTVYIDRGRGRLSGTLTLNFVNGVAAHTDLAIIKTRGPVRISAITYDAMPS